MKDASTALTDCRCRKIESSTKARQSLPTIVNESTKHTHMHDLGPAKNVSLFVPMRVDDEQQYAA